MNTVDIPRRLPVTPQANKVLGIIRRDGHITRLTAMHYGIANLTARITELRDALYTKGLDVVCVKRHDDNGHLYGRWSVETRELEIA